MNAEPRVYLDYNATAPLRPEARAALLAALDAAGNPSSVHAEGRVARRLVEDARERIAWLAGARAPEVVLTSGATEALNAVVRGGYDVVLAAATEHAAVLAPIAASGARHVVLAVDRSGRIDPEALAAALDGIAPTQVRALLAVQMANNETGVRQDVARLAALARARGVDVVTDAVQAAGRLPLDMAALGVDALVISAHKIGGPKGAGALVTRSGWHAAPLVHGGGQERGRRAGTENVAAVAGFGAAAEAALRDLSDMARLAALRDHAEREVLRITPSAVVVGGDVERIANTACIALPGATAETLVIRLDLAGFAVSAGAACSSGKVGASPALAAMGLGAELARGAIRLSLGHATTEDDITRFLAAWQRVASAMGAGSRTEAAAPARRAPVALTSRRGEA